MTESPSRGVAGFAGFVAALLMLLGLALGAGGGWLLVLGGSAGYLVVGIGLLATGLLLRAGRSTALWLYALVALGMLVWAVWEAGLDWWPLAARLDLLFVVGLLMLLPWTTQPLGRGHAATRRGETRPARAASAIRPSGARAIAVVLAAYALVAVAAWVADPHTLAGVLPAVSAPSAAGSAAADGTPPGDWPAYGRTGYGQRYSPLDRITPANVGRLQLAWQFHTGDVRGRPGDPVETTYEVTPLKVGNRLFLCTPHQSVIALDATSGRQLWRRDLALPAGLALQHLTCRGLSYRPPDGAGAAPAAAAAPAVAGSAAAGPAATAAMMAAGSASGEAAMPGRVANPTVSPAAAAPSGAAGDCAAGRLFMPTADGRLVALDPDSGASCSRFGAGRGEVDLLAGMPNRRPGAYYSTSPPVVTRRLVIVGGTVLDNVSTREQSGVIRAYDVDTGALVWNWDSGNPDDTAPIAPGRSYTANSPNSWSISSVDEALGLVYVPLGNQPPDQWGGRRSAAVERFSSSVVALDLATGAVRWVFQTVHHDLWDYDVPSQPSLVDLTIGGKAVPALVQPTKQGEVFVLDRRTGRPLLPVEEVPAPQGAAAGDRSAPTQPRSALSFDPPRLAGRDMWGATMFDQLACRIAFHRLRYDGRFTPPSVQGSLIHPGNFGVFNWGGVAVDPLRQVMFATPARLAFVSRLVPRPDDTALMVQADGPPKGSLPALNENFGAPFAVELRPFTSPLGLPCQAPPWGLVAGADLATGRIAWQHPNGTVRDLSPLPLPFRMGVPNLGGPIVTAGGVAFLSGTLDYFVRAYDLTSGAQLWQARLPAGGQATPMTYLGADGRQYLLVVAGGHGSTQTRAGDSILAYALP